MKKIDIDDFRIHGGKKLDLHEVPTKVKDFYDSKDDYKDKIEEHMERISELQELLYASNQHALLVIFQGMDSAGKDGAIKHVLSGVNPAGFQVASFKQPSTEELEHDFLWRTTKQLPERGRIGIFNRSYYEEVLVVKVHPEYLEGQNLPADMVDMDSLWEDRYRSIVEHEAHLTRNGIKVIKIFLHLSKDEQRQRFLDRINEPEKNWKFSMGDVAERKLWKKYQAAFEDCLAATSTKDAPWYAVPADDKKNARMIVATIILETLESFKMEYPQVSDERLAEMQQIKQQLEAEEED